MYTGGQANAPGVRARDWDCSTGLAGRVEARFEALVEATVDEEEDIEAAEAESDDDCASAPFVES